MSDATSLLLRWNSGEQAARDALMLKLYDELNGIAARHLARERHNLELQPNALVHEAYLKLIDMNRVAWNDRAHFMAMAARVMRQILIDQARKRNAAKRDGGFQVTLTGIGQDTAEQRTDLLMLHAAIEKLVEIDPERARLVELRFFGGLTFDEAAEVVGRSPRTLKRQWAVARGWLYRELTRDPPAPGPAHKAGAGDPVDDGV